MEKKASLFLEKFRRITSAGYYMPEIDGLRFIAVFWVVALMHTSNFINVKFYNSSLFSSYVSSVIIEGGYGVSLFFMISGFILALPFARQRMQGAGKVSLKSYYLRRLTRLEPPYLAALIIAFTGLVFIKKEFSFTGLLPHLAASAIYSHGFIYGSKSWVLGVAWSLEVEVQFYILAPLLTIIYSLKKAIVRRAIFIVLILFSGVYAFINFWKGGTGLQYALHCFLIGMFLCDLYLNNIRLKGNTNFWFISGILLFLLLPLFVSIYDLTSYLLKHLLLALLFYIGITNSKMKHLLSVQGVSIIGGMCYSIYLIHFMIMSTAFPVLQKFQTGNPWVTFIIFFLIITFLVLSGGMIFYRFIEQPCMRRDWYNAIFKRKRIEAEA